MCATSVLIKVAQRMSAGLYLLPLFFIFIVNH